MDKTLSDSNNIAQSSLLLALPAELIYKIISNMPREAMLTFARTAQKAHHLVQEEILDTRVQGQKDRYRYIKLLKHNLKILKPQYQDRHPDYAIYQDLTVILKTYNTYRAGMGFFLIQSAAGRNETTIEKYKEVWLSYPSLYKKYLFAFARFYINVGKNFQGKKCLIPVPNITGAYDNTFNHFIAQRSKDYNQKPLMEYFVQQLIEKQYISSETSILVLALLKKYTGDFQKSFGEMGVDTEKGWEYIAKSCSTPEHSLKFSNDQDCTTACQRYGQTYDLLHAIITGYSHDKKERLEFYARIKEKAQAQQVPAQPSSSKWSPIVNSR